MHPTSFRLKKIQGKKKRDIAEKEALIPEIVGQDEPTPIFEEGESDEAPMLFT